MKEFVVYTLMRLALLAGTLGIVIGIWSLVADDVWIPGALVVAFVVSGVGSLVLLNRQREAFAQRVQVRAERATKAFEELRAREDASTDTSSDTSSGTSPDAGAAPGVEPARDRPQPRREA
ncbi:MAG: DUF4229 domain-containing protein [Nocardioides sp.]|nr:DUF4229 domain-containing protein [Nocardioides sp.]